MRRCQTILAVVGSGMIAAGIFATALPAPAEARTVVGIGVGIGVPVYAPPPPVYYYPPPPVYYPPPPVVYAPPPVVYSPPVVAAPAPVMAQPPVVAPASAPPPQTGNCRQYKGDATIDGKNQPFYGTACLQPDGKWHIVN